AAGSRYQHAPESAWLTRADKGPRRTLNTADRAYRSASQAAEHPGSGAGTLPRRDRHHPSAAFTRSGVNGVWRRRTPASCATALPARAIERHVRGAREQRARVVDEGEAQTAAVALPAPVRHAGNRLHHFACARRALEEVKPERHRIDAAFHRDLVDERLGREL